MDMDMVDMLGMMDMVDMLGMMDMVDMVDMMDIVDVVIILMPGKIRYSCLPKLERTFFCLENQKSF